MFLHLKEEQISTISIRLHEVQLVYDKGQDIITIDWRNNQQTQECKILNKLDLIWKYNNV